MICSLLVVSTVFLFSLRKALPETAVMTILKRFLFFSLLLCVFALDGQRPFYFEHDVIGHHVEDS